jgi:hypothetical protein
MKKSDIGVEDLGETSQWDYEIRYRGRYAWVLLRETRDGHWTWELHGRLRHMEAHSPTQYGTRTQALDAAVKHFQVHRGWTLA